MKNVSIRNFFNLEKKIDSEKVDQDEVFQS